MTKDEIDLEAGIIRDNMSGYAEELRFALIEIKKDKPTMSGKIMGMDFQQFSLVLIFTILFDFEDGILDDTENGDPYGVLQWQVKKYAELRADCISVLPNFDDLYKEMRGRNGRYGILPFDKNGFQI